MDYKMQNRNLTALVIFIMFEGLQKNDLLSLADGEMSIKSGKSHKIWQDITETSRISNTLSWF